MKKVSFSVSSKTQSTLKRPSSSSSSSSSAAANDEESREFITVFDSSKTLSAEPTKNPQNRIIAPKPNEWMPFNNSTGNNPNLPPQFEVESSAVSDAITHGLNLRGNDDAGGEQNPSLRCDVDPSLIKLREDLKRLPEMTRFDEFEDVPVEEFGRALLGGYGWLEGMGIGRNAKEDVKVVQCRKWTANEGLGFSRIRTRE